MVGTLAFGLVPVGLRCGELELRGWLGHAGIGHRGFDVPGWGFEVGLGTLGLGIVVSMCRVGALRLAWARWDWASWFRCAGLGLLGVTFAFVRLLFHEVIVRVVGLSEEQAWAWLLGLGAGFGFSFLRIIELAGV